MPARCRNVAEIIGCFEDGRFTNLSVLSCCGPCFSGPLFFAVDTISLRLGLAFLSAMKSPINTEPTASACQPGVLPLPTLLSHVLIAFTIEFDNEFEHQMPHRVTASTSAPESSFGPWLVSMVMFSNFLQFVGEDGVTVEELQRQARTANLSLAGMERWGYVSVGVAAGESRPNPPLRNRVVRPTAKGRRAAEVWRPLFGVIEERWQSRFGASEIDRLRESLLKLVSQFER